MSNTAQYATIPKNGVGQLSVANTNRDGTGTLALVAFASAKSGGGARVDALAIQATSTTTAGMLRFYLVKGRPLGNIASITFVGTTAVVTTELPHGLSTGQTLTLMGAQPDEYNVIDAPVTVSSATSFTYVMGIAPVCNATVVGSAASSLAVPVARLILETAVSAIVPSATVLAFATTVRIGPLVLQAGWSLRASTHNAEAFNVIPTICGDFA